jgi:hypothetical protein
MEDIMPSNVIQINHSDELTWEVGDSEIDKSITYLDEIGDTEKITFYASSPPCSQTSTQV